MSKNVSSVQLVHSLKKAKDKYENAKRLLELQESVEAKILFEEAMMHYIVLRKYVSKEIQPRRREIQSEIDRIIRLCQEHLHTINLQESEQENSEKQLKQKLRLTRYFNDNEGTPNNNNNNNMYVDDLKYYTHFTNKCFSDPWHFQVLSLLLKPVLFQMNVAKHNLITLYGPKSIGKTFFLHALERYTKTIQELKNHTQWIVLNVFQLQKFVTEKITSEYLHTLKKYTYIVLEAITLSEYEQLKNNTHYFEPFLRMIDSHSKCFFIAIIHESKPTGNNPHNDDNKSTVIKSTTSSSSVSCLDWLKTNTSFVHFQSLSPQSIYYFFKHAIIQHYCQLFHIQSSNYEPYKDPEQFYKQIPILDIIEQQQQQQNQPTKGHQHQTKNKKQGRQGRLPKNKNGDDEDDDDDSNIKFMRHPQFIMDFDTFHIIHELYDVGNQIYQQLPSIDFDSLQKIFFNAILQSNELVVQSKQFVLASFPNNTAVCYVPVGSFRQIVQQQILSPEIFLLFNDAYDNIKHELIVTKTHKNEDHTRTSQVKDTFYHTMFFNDLYPESDQRYSLFILPNKSNFIMKFTNLITFENALNINPYELYLLRTFLLYSLSLERQMKLLKHEDTYAVDSVLQFSNPKSDKLFFKKTHVETKFFESTESIFQQSFQNSTSLQLMFIVDFTSRNSSTSSSTTPSSSFSSSYSNMYPHSKRSAFRFQIGMNEKNTKDLYPMGLSEAMPIEDLTRVFANVMNQNLTDCVVKKISYQSGFRLIVQFLNLKNIEEISNIEIFKTDQNVSCLCLPMIPFIEKTCSLSNDYCITNPMDYYLVFQEIADFRGRILTPLTNEQVKMLNEIYNDEQKFHLQLLFNIMKLLESSVPSTSFQCNNNSSRSNRSSSSSSSSSSSKKHKHKHDDNHGDPKLPREILKELYEEIYSYCCELLHIPNTNYISSAKLYEDTLDENVEEISEGTLYSKIDLYFLRRKRKLSHFLVNPFIYYKLFQFFSSMSIFQSLFDAYNIYIENITTTTTCTTTTTTTTKKNNNDNNNNKNVYHNEHSNANHLMVHWYMESDYTDEMDIRVKNNQELTSFLEKILADSSHFCNKDLINYASERSSSSSFFQSFENENIHLYYYFEDKNNDDSHGRQFFNINNLHIESNLEATLLQYIHNPFIASTKFNLISHEKHKKLLLSLILADKYVRHSSTLEMNFLAFYIYFHKISINKCEFDIVKNSHNFFDFFVKDIEESLNYIQNKLEIHTSTPIYFRQKTEINTGNPKSSALVVNTIEEIHKVLNREIVGGLQQIKNSYITSTMILDQFYLHLSN